MKKADLEKLNLEIAQFLVRLCHDSDVHYGSRRTPSVERRYRQAKRFIKRSGLEYPPRRVTSDQGTK